ncbi:MAG: leucine-rich repeat domain-containing protein [Candidatus Sigynarchaeota archaeon]
MASLADLIRKDLEDIKPDVDRPFGIVLNKAITWRAGGTETILDSSGNVIDNKDGNKVAEQMLRPGIHDIILDKCKALFVLLHPDNWQLFQGADTKVVVERVLKKFLPLTNLQLVLTDNGVDAISRRAGDNWLTRILASFVGSLGAISFTNIFMDIVEKQLDYVDWARRALAIAEMLLCNDPTGHAWLIHKSASILKECSIASKRRVFDDFLTRNGKQPMLVDALLRAGSMSEDKGDDVLDLLGLMDRDTVATFINRDMRVVHANFFLRLYTLRTTPASKRPARVKLDDTEREELLRERMQKDKQAGDIASKVLAYLKMANPWALDRQFTSWKKRISDTALDREKVNKIKGIITKQLDAARKTMITSEELVQFGEVWQGLVLDGDAAGKQRREVNLDALEQMGVPRGVVDALAVILPPKDPALPVVHVLDCGQPPPVLPLLPPEFKKIPWIMLHKGSITGIGLSGIRLREIPPAINELSKLKFLDLSNNAIKNVESLGTWPDLRCLDLSRNLLTNFEPSGKKVPVHFLDLHCNNLKNVDVTFARGGLEVLDLSRNQFTKMSQIKGLDTCQKLDSVNLAWNKLDNLQDCPAMERLKVLFLNGNGIVKLENDTTIPSVERLDLSDNNLGALKGISNFPAVSHVDVHNNYLKNTREIDTMPHLREFLASGNQIDSLGNLLHLAKLRLLDLRGNPLTGIKKDEERARYLFAPVRFAKGSSRADDLD